MRSTLSFVPVKRTTRISTEIPHNYYITATYKGEKYVQLEYLTLTEANKYAREWADSWGIMKHDVTIKRA